MERDPVAVILEAAGDRARSRRENVCATGMARIFRRQGRALPIAKLARSHATEADVPDDDWPDEEEAIAALLLAVALATSIDAANSTLARTRIGGIFRPDDAWRQRLARDAARVAERIERTSRERIAAILARGGEPGALSRDVRKEFRNWATRNQRGYFSRANAIGRNEVTTAWNRAMHETLARNGWATRLWLTQGDDRVDAGGLGGPCVENEAAGAVPLGQAFPSGHMYPPSHVACRCSLVMGEPGQRPDTPWRGGDGGLGFEMPEREL